MSIYERGLPIVGEQVDALETTVVRMPNGKTVEVPIVAVVAFGETSLFQLQQLIETTVTAVLNKRAVAAAVKGNSKNGKRR